MIEELIRLSDMDKSMDDIKDELTTALKLSNVEFVVITDINKKQFKFKIYVKGQDLTKHTEHSVEVVFGWFEGATYDNMLDAALYRVWKDNGSNFYLYMGEIIVSYQKALNKL